MKSKEITDDIRRNCLKEINRLGLKNHFLRLYTFASALLAARDEKKELSMLDFAECYYFILLCPYTSDTENLTVSRKVILTEIIDTDYKNVLCIN